MLCIPEIYGQDADGNRGKLVYDYTIEPSDAEHILDYLKDFLTENNPLPESIPEVLEIPFINTTTEEDVVLDVNTEDYLPILPVYKVVDKLNFKLFAKTLVKFNRPVALSLSLYLIELLAAKR